MMRSSGSRWVAGWLLAAGLAAAAAGDEATVEVDAGAPIGLTNPELVGFGANRFPLTSPAARDALRPLAPRTFRLDASIEHLVDCPAGALNAARLAELQARIDGIEELGAETLLILSYMPPCLARTRPGDPRDPTKQPPADPAAWQALVAELVAAVGPGRAASGRRPVRYYEVWNEPDLPVFFQGSLVDFIDRVALPSGRAVARVEATSGLDLRYGVCGCFTANPTWLGPTLLAARAAAVPVDFISWHYYTTLGPDGAEPGFPEALQVFAPLAEHPFNGPAGIGPMTEEVRALAQATLGSVPELMIDEWNLSGGGFDLRNDSHEGAAFQAAGLAAMASAGLARAALFNGIDKDDFAADGSPLPPRYGGWGVIDRALARKPAWYSHWLWHRLGTVRLASPQDPIAGLWTAAAGVPSNVQVLIAAYEPRGTTARTVALALRGLAPGSYLTDLYRIDADHPGATEPSSRFAVVVAADGSAQLSVPLPAQAVAFVELPEPGAAASLAAGIALLAALRRPRPSVRKRPREVRLLASAISATPSARCTARMHSWLPASA